MLAFLNDLSATKAKILPAPASEPPLPLVEDDIEYVFDAARPAQRDLVLDDMHDRLDAVQLDKQLQLKKWTALLCCSVSTLLGVTLSLWGMATTVFFEKYQRNMTIFYCSFVLYVPFFLWIKMLLWPGAAEARRRQRITAQRDWRQRVKKTQLYRYMGWDKEDEEEAERRAKSPEEMARLKREATLREIRNKIGKNTFKLGHKQAHKPAASNYYHKSITSVRDTSRGLNIVVAQNGREVTRPPPILPDVVLALSTAQKLPGYQENKYHTYCFQHPYVEGEKRGAEIRDAVVKNYPSNTIKLFGDPTDFR